MVVNERDIATRQPGPHEGEGTTTAYPFFADATGFDLVFRKRALHPGATIGRRFFIDHGMGVVIGETAVVGDDVTLYQGVTLGGTGKERGKRHPTLGNDVIVGVGAKVLGAIEIGDGARIGGGSVVLKDVPPHTTAVGVPARAVAWTDPHSGRTERKEHLPDPTRETLRVLADRIDELEQRFRQMESTHQNTNLPVSK